MLRHRRVATPSQLALLQQLMKAVLVGDTLTLANAVDSKAITMGAGNDTVILFTGTTAAAGGINGGGGTNTLQMVAADAVTASGSATFATQVTHFQDLTLTGDAGVQLVHVGVLGGYNTVTTGGDAGTLTMDGFTSGGTLNLTSAAAGGYVITLTPHGQVLHQQHPSTSVWRVALPRMTVLSPQHMCRRSTLRQRTPVQEPLFSR